MSPETFFGTRWSRASGAVKARRGFLYSLENPMKALRTFVVVAVVMGVGIWAALQIFLRLPVPRYTGKVSLDGVKQVVEVRYDGFGVPHIFAEDEEDLFFAQGYVTARERMFQMDLSRRAGRGELSALLGERTLGADRFLRTAGFYRTAKTEYANTSPRGRKVLEAYARGVNAYVQTTRHKPLEYILLGADIEPWRPEDSVVCGVLVAYLLTRSKEADLVFHELAERLGWEKVKELFPSFPDHAPAVIQRGEKPPEPKAPWPDLEEVLMRSLVPEIPGSNWFVFSGERTATGKPLLAGSPDLEPKIPALFYLVHLKAGEIDVIGGALPGAPGIHVLGLNGHMAWSTTNGRVDELDFFIEKENPDNPSQYLTKSGYRDYEVLHETIKVKTGSGFREEPLKIKISRHGPIISGLLPLAPQGCSMSWVGSEPTGLIEACYALNRARDFQEFRKALSLWKTPSLNFCYADSRGNIGYQFAASIPKRRKGEGLIPAPGWSGEYDWEGLVPFHRLPYDYNPTSGYVASFNNMPQRTPYFISHFFMFERALRFQEILAEKEVFDLADMKRIQYDSVSVVAKRWVPHLLRILQREEEISGLSGLLERWDFSMDRESPAAALFSAFYFRMMENTLADEVGEEIWKEHLARPMALYIPDMVLTRIMERNDSPWFDDIRTPQVKETRDDIMIRSVRQAVRELSERLGNRPERWTWGRVHTMTFRHPLGGKLPFLNLRPIPTQGDGFTINAGAWDNLHPYAMDTGGCIRMVVDFSDLERSTFMSPPGQSGHFLSPHYDDLARLWADGEQIPAHYLSAKGLPRVFLMKPRAE